MSYDLQVWSVRPVDPSSVLPDPSGWTENGGTRTHVRRQWQIVIGRSVKVLPEDVPEEIARALPGIDYLTEINLSPIDAPEAARKFLSRSGTAIARATHGVIFDPQADQLTLPSGIKRYAKPEASESASVVAMTWWFVEGPISRGEFEPLLDVLGTEVPEALPRRYGSFEPPQHVYAETHREHFLRFLGEHLRGQVVVWCPSAPVANVRIGLPENIGPSKRGFRCAYFGLDVDAELLSQAGWQSGLQRLWRSLSHILQPFYGDVRTLSGYRRNRGRYWLTRSTQRHPVTAWWWCGLPTGPAHAIVLGKPYGALWPEFTAVATADAGLAFADSDDWRPGKDVFKVVGEPPADVVRVNRERGPEVVPNAYPTKWPFGPPRLP